MAIRTYKQMKSARLVRWDDVPDYLRLDPARALRIYGELRSRAEHEIEMYFGNVPKCMFAINGLMHYWGHEFFQQCKLAVKPGYLNVCAKHFKMASHAEAQWFISETCIVRGDMDPDRIEQEWAAIADRTASY